MVLLEEAGYREERKIFIMNVDRTVMEKLPILTDRGHLLQASPVRLTRRRTCGHYSTDQAPGRQKEVCRYCASGELGLQVNMK